jgi:hypothetical protein
MSTAERYIEIKPSGSSASGLTRTWMVHNKRTGENCGSIRWHGAFRKYCFYPPEGFLYDASCLQAITDHLVHVNMERKEERRILKTP